MVAVAITAATATVAADAITTATHRFIFNFQCSLFRRPVVHSFLPLTHFTFEQTNDNKKISLFQFFTHSLRLITTPRTTIRTIICLQSVGCYCRARSNHLKIYVEMITLNCVRLSRLSYARRRLCDVCCRFRLNRFPTWIPRRKIEWYTLARVSKDPNMRDSSDPTRPLFKQPFSSSPPFIISSGAFCVERCIWCGSKLHF